MSKRIPPLASGQNNTNTTSQSAAGCEVANEDPVFSANEKPQRSGPGYFYIKARENDGASANRQRTVCKQLARANGFRQFEEFYDVMSTSDVSPEIGAKRLISKLKQNPDRALFLSDTDRIFRSASSEVIQALYDSQVVVIDPIGEVCIEAVWDMQDAAEAELENLSAELKYKAAMRKRVLGIKPSVTTP